MASNKTRLEIVETSAKLAGRGPEIYAEARNWLTLLLDDLSFSAKWQALRKIGSEIALPAGSSTAPLPSDIGAGSAHLLFGTDRTPIYEKSSDEFMDLGGIPGSGVANARPSFYMIDEEAGVFRFNRAADQAYGFIPVYYKRPAAPASGSAGDSEHCWFSNDQVIIDGLIYYIFKFKEDSREYDQKRIFEAGVEKYKAGTTPQGGGVPRIRLSPQFFPGRRL